MSNDLVKWLRDNVWLDRPDILDKCADAIERKDAALQMALDILEGIFDDLDDPFEADSPWLSPVISSIIKIKEALNDSD